jgi:hypothetical protein
MLFNYYGKRTYEGRTGCLQKDILVDSKVLE